MRKLTKRQASRKLNELYALNFNKQASTEKRASLELEDILNDLYDWCSTFGGCSSDLRSALREYKVGDLPASYLVRENLKELLELGSPDSSFLNEYGLRMKEYKKTILRKYSSKNASSKYSRDVIIDILSDVGEFTPLRKEFKLDKDLEVIGTGKERYDSEGQGYREIIPGVPIQTLMFSYGQSWLEEDELVISITFQNWSEDQWSMKNVSSMSPVKLARRIAKEILKRSSKVDFERNWDDFGDEDVPTFYTDEGPRTRYSSKKRARKVASERYTYYIEVEPPHGKVRNEKELAAWLMKNDTYNIEEAILDYTDDYYSDVDGEIVIDSIKIRDMEIDVGDKFDAIYGTADIFWDFKGTMSNTRFDENRRRLARFYEGERGSKDHAKWLEENPEIEELWEAEKVDKDTYKEKLNKQSSRRK